MSKIQGEAAPRRSAEGRAQTKGDAKRQSAHREHKLDRALDDSFPASDPLPASQGST